MQHFFAGFLTCFQPFHLLLMLLGVCVGIIFGALPGLNASICMALFLPFTYTMEPQTAFCFLVACYVGAVSGGLISAILINIPGTASSVATTFDGHPMAKRGDGYKALGTGVFFSFLGTLFSIVVLISIAPMLAKFALKFAVYEYWAIATFSLTLICALSGKNITKGLLAGFLGMLISMVGIAPVDGFTRFTFGFQSLNGGFALIPVLIGTFAIPEIVSAAQREKEEKLEGYSVNQGRGLGFTIQEGIAQIKNFLISASIGTAIGILPGIGGGTSNIMAYAACKRVSKHPEKYGTGIMDGIVASEAANNATIGGAFIPLLALGIPGDVITAVLLGAFTIHGISPGPSIFTANASLVYLIYAALVVANFLMLFVEWIGMRGFVKILRVPQNVLLPVVLVLCCVGAYSINNRMFDVWTFFFFGLFGLLMRRFEIPRPPIVLGLVLAEMFEVNLRRSIQFSSGQIIAYLSRPITMFFLAFAALMVLTTIVSHIRSRKGAAPGK